MQALAVRLYFQPAEDSLGLVEAAQDPALLSVEDLVELDVAAEATDSADTRDAASQKMSAISSRYFIEFGNT